MNNCAYVSIVTNESYLGGAMVLKHSLDKVHSKAPFYLLLPEDSDKSLVDKVKAANINILYESNFDDNVLELAGMSYWRDTLFKLKVFKLLQFKKIVFLDSDMIVLKNIDHLFEKPHMSAVAAGGLLHKDWKDLNSGLMVIEPSQEEYEKLVSCIKTAYDAKMMRGGNMLFGDQDVIQYVYPEWQPDKKLHLPEVYNVMLGYGGYLRKDKQISGPEDIYVYHFTGREKPWGTKMDNIKIRLKIIKRSKSMIDFKICDIYKSQMKEMDLMGK